MFVSGHYDLQQHRMKWQSIVIYWDNPFVSAAESISSIVSRMCCFVMRLHIIICGMVNSRCLHSEQTDSHLLFLSETWREESEVAADVTYEYLCERPPCDLLNVLPFTDSDLHICMNILSMKCVCVSMCRSEIKNSRPCPCLAAVST